MSRPATETITASNAVWYTRVNRNFQDVLTKPLALYMSATPESLLASHPPSLYLDCLAIVGSPGSASLYKSTGTVWAHFPTPLTFIEDLAPAATLEDVKNAYNILTQDINFWLVPNDNLLQNGRFTGDIGWTLANSEVIDNVLVVTGGARFIAQNAGLTTGADYFVSFEYTETSGNSLRVNTGPNNEDQSALLTTTAGTGSGVISGVVTAIGPYFAIEANLAVFTGTIDNAYVVAV